ncbi:MAG: DNA mismatch repair endonuclease MutL [Desulfuromonadales bacterium]|nr:DNA mismatch repair endonuclease MutL [Desulfuromonadales bacterium]
MNNKPTIQILPEELCNKIAAGEVVERPSSVVKELLENALDAGATEVLIELGGGGKTLIRITDNGCGMNRQDALLCFERHATSKISTDDDLFALKTLGFRGEALASIASVSRMNLKTCDNVDGLGHHIQIEGGKIKKVDQLGLPVGTSIEVRNLFFNLPARKKFLRKDQTELGHAADVVSKLALARPDVSFRLLHQDRLMLDLRHEKGLAERLAALLGRSLLRDMLPVDEAGSESLRITGLISRPDLNRSSTSHIYTFINGRYIRDRVVQHAIMDGYRHLLMKGRYPVVALFLAIEPALVDVNVHPTKHEVRFRDQGIVHDFIAATLQRILKPSDWITQPRTCDPASAPSLPPWRQQQPLQHHTGGNAPAEAEPLVREEARSFTFSKMTADLPVTEVALKNPDTALLEQMQQDDLPTGKADGFFSNLHILGHYHQTYILCQDQSDLVLIDQHAAHERIGFERLKKAYQEGGVQRQQLLFPEVFELDYKSAAALEEYLAELERLGFEIEPFGGKAFAVKALPALLAAAPVATLVTDVALELERIGREGQLAESIDDVLILMACHRVIRANQALNHQEIKALLADLDRIDFKGHCPHGRPVLARMRLYEIERLFRRHG